jgi:arylsulfatase A
MSYSNHNRIYQEQRMTETKDRMTRREFIKRGLYIGGAAALTGVSYRVVRDQVGRDFQPARAQSYLEGIHPPQNLQSLPNIIVILADDLGYGDLSVYGNTPIQTPNLERMARQGVRMSSFYAAAPVCTPSRAALLTGRYPIRTHMTLPLYPHNHPMEYALKLVNRYRYDVTGIPVDEVLLPEALQQRGYRTGLVGKWHLGDRKNHVPNDNGFDFFYGALYSNDVKKFAILRNREVEIPSPVDQDRITQSYTREALQFIEDNKECPFFLYLAHTAVHEPLFAGASFRGTSEAGLYGDSVEEVDWSVGQIFDKLKSLSLDDHTLVIFSSDNGPWWQGDPGGLRGRKNNVMEGGLRVPFIARWPGMLPENQVSDALSINFDITPTCMAAAGISPPADRIIDGADMLPTLRGEAPGPHDTFYYYDGPILVAIRYQHWKYHRRHMSDNGGYPIFSDGPFLFDLQNDPNESYSLIDSQPEVAQMLTRMLDDWEAEMDENVRGWL